MHLYFARIIKNDKNKFSVESIHYAKYNFMPTLHYSGFLLLAKMCFYLLLCSVTPYHILIHSFIR